MGLRMNKAIGWVMACPVDPLNRETDLAEAPLSVHGTWLNELAARTADEELRSDMEYSASAHIPHQGSPVTLGDCALWTPQLEDGTLIMLPPEYAGVWHRTDDDLDFAFDDAQTNVLEYTNLAHFPYAGQWMDVETGLLMNGHAQTLKRAEWRGAVAAEPAWHDRLARLVRPVSIKAESPFSSADQALERLVPMVPNSARWLAEHLGIIDDPADVLRLRPARAIWWE